MNRNSILTVIATFAILALVVFVGAGLGSDLNAGPYACQNAAGYSQLCNR